MILGRVDELAKNKKGNGCARDKVGEWVHAKLKKNDVEIKKRKMRRGKGDGQVK